MPLFQSADARDAITAYEVVPSKADAGVKQYDEPSIAINRGDLPEGAPLAIFMPGTGGRPANAIDLMKVIADQGYRVIGLEYNDEPAVVQVCPQDPDPNCSVAFREMRITGTGAKAPVSNSVAESIVSRSVAMLRVLDQAHPTEGWGAYLDGDQPRWNRLVLTGLSQGAGMAAYMAKQHMVRRVVLFSSPWDFVGQDRLPAPWLSDPSATPTSRWQAEYHARENTADLLRVSYQRLGIPPANIRIFSHSLPAGIGQNSPNPYHGATIRDASYADEWRSMFGSGAEQP